MKKRNKSFDALLILGCVFSGLGFIYCIVALIVEIAINSTEATSGLHGAVGIIPALFGGLGVIFVAIGVPFLIYRARKIRTAEEVTEEGYYIMAVVTDIYPNHSISVNGRHPYIIECQYRDTISGTVHVFKSDNISFRPNLERNTPIKVYLDHNNFSRYHVDADSVLGNVEIH